MLLICYLQSKIIIQISANEVITYKHWLVAHYNYTLRFRSCGLSRGD